MRRQCSTVIALALLALGAPATGAAGETAPAAGDDGDFVAEDAWVKFKLTHAGKTHEHPGYLAVAGEEMILTMGSKAGSHEVSILLELSDAGAWSAKVAYKVAGKPVLSGDKAIRPKKWISFKSDGGKSRVQLRVDPDSDGAEDIDLGKGKGPLDGLK